LLARIGAPAIPVLLDLTIEAGLGDRIVDVLDGIGATAVTPLIEALAHTDVRRIWAARALGRVGDERAIQPLVELRTSESSQTGGSALEMDRRLTFCRELDKIIAQLKSE
jgi:HEAT repeat protein